MMQRVSKKTNADYRKATLDSEDTGSSPISIGSSAMAGGDQNSRKGNETLHLFCDVLAVWNQNKTAEHRVSS